MTGPGAGPGGVPVVHRYGDRALLLDFAGSIDVLAAYAALRAQPPDGLVDLVPAECSLLVITDSVPDPQAVLARLRAATSDQPGLGGRPDEPVPGAPVEVLVRYDGPDLDDVARRTQRTADDVISLHSGPTYTAAFCGFAPGFAYLTGLPAALHVPRRDTPRTAVPAGSVALSDRYTAVYPQASPGGWHLIGRTDAALWRIDRTPPALLTAGTRVRFVPTVRL